MPKRVLIFSEGISTSHVIRPIVAENALAARGFQTVFACDRRHQSFLKEVKGKVVFLDSIPGEEVFARIRKGKSLFPYSVLEKYAEEDLALLKTHQPDLALGDMRWSLGATARAANIPYAAITNSYWSPLAQYDPILPAHWLISVLGRKLSNHLFQGVYPLVARSFCWPMNRLLAKFGLPALGHTLPELNTYADALLFADMPPIHSLPQQLPSNHYYIGPCLWSEKASLPVWWDDVPRNRPVVYTSLGSSGNTRLLPRIIRAMKGLGVSLIVGGLDQPPDPTSGIFCAKWLPAQECCELASLFIGNGGSTSSYLAVSRGVPVLGIVSYFEQALSMQGFHRAGVGVLLKECDATEGVLRSTASSLISNPSFSNKANALREDFLKFDNFNLVPKVIGEILEKSEWRRAA